MTTMTVSPGDMPAKVKVNRPKDAEPLDYSRARDKAWSRLRKLVVSGASSKALDRAARSLG